MDVTGFNELYVLLAGVLAGVLEYFPVVRERFEQLTAWQKRVVVVALLLLIVVVMRLADCEGGFGQCGVDLAGLVDMAAALLLGVGVNQGAYKLIKRESLWVG